MALITAHWAATQPLPCVDYHDEFALHGGIQKEIMDECLDVIHGKSTLTPKLVNFVKPSFLNWKQFPFTLATNYGTYHLNHDPRDGSPNVEIGALCMGGEGVNVPGPWGKWPYTAAHAVMQAAIIARICHLKDINPRESFDQKIAPAQLQNGPIFTVSTHAERAIQTPDQPYATARPSFGYFIYSGDGDSRWDLAAL